MNAYTVSIPILVAAVMATIVAVFNPEPRYHIGDANKMVEGGHIADVGQMVEERYTYAIPRIVVDLEGDLSPVGETWGNIYDAPPFALKPTTTPTPIPVATIVATARPVPAECPPVFVEVFGANAGPACRVSLCESGWRLDAMNITPPDDSHGPLQVNFYGSLGPSRLALVQSLGYPVTTQDEAKALLRSDWYASLRTGYVISSGGTNWGPWSCPAW